MALAMMLAAVFSACNEKEDNGVPDEGEEEVAVTGVSLSQTTAELTEGETLTLIAVVLPENATNTAVAWASSNTDVATVADGLVNAVAAGTATITATTQDGGKTASCAVTVTTAYVAVTGITLNLTNAELIVGDTLRLTATVLPENATYKNDVVWEVRDELNDYFSSPVVVRVSDDGLVTAVGDGTATVVVRTVENNFEATCTVTVTTNLGTVSFATSETWTVGSQTWSDAVQTSYCGGITTSEYNVHVPCRSNPGYKGDLFMPYAVYKYQNIICPEGWRVPTAQDFTDLDIALGGSGSGQQNSAALRDKYLDTWGGAYGGYCSESYGELNNQGLEAHYWSQTEDIYGYGYYSLLFRSDGVVYPNIAGISGYSLRCVR